MQDSSRSNHGYETMLDYQISWLFFSATQLYAYQYTFNMDNFDKKEQTLEYFYKDVTNFATSSDTEETEVWNKKAKKFMKEKAMP